MNAEKILINLTKFQVSIGIVNSKYLLIYQELVEDRRYGFLSL